VSQTSREVERAPGAILRLSVAVLIDGVREADANGVMQWSPRPAEELEALRALVASTVGFNEARGDVITLRSLPFEPLALDEGSTASGSLIERLSLDIMGIIRLLALAAVILFLALFVLRPILRQGARPADDAFLPGPMPVGLPGVAGPVLTGEIDDGSPVEGAVQSPRTEEAANPVDRMRQLISERQDETLEILRHWMEEPEEPR